MEANVPLVPWIHDISGKSAVDLNSMIDDLGIFISLYLRATISDEY